MEKTASVEERIRRAEEIYQRRRAQGVRVYSNSASVMRNSPSISLFKKMIIKIIICIIIYSSFYLIKNSNYFFSQDVINKTSQILSYDMNLQGMFNDIKKYFDNLKTSGFISTQNTQNVDSQNKEEENKEKDSENINENEQVNQNENNKTENEKSNLQNEDAKQMQNEDSNKNEQTTGGIGGADEQINISNNEEISQMELDAKYIINNFELNIPLKGTVTSRFGIRTPTDIISANHAGIDIGANEGTKIVAAMAGKVMSVSWGGDYGNHIIIANKNVTTLYAHCKTVYAKDGDEIKKGTEIAEVGSTGRATRTTFTF